MGQMYPDIRLPCGQVAEFDHNSGISYRCTTCWAVYGSVGMPRSCRELMEQEQVMDKLSGKTHFTRLRDQL